MYKPEVSHAYYLRHRKERIEFQKSWYRAHRLEILAKWQKFNRENPEITKTYKKVMGGGSHGRAKREQ